MKFLLKRNFRILSCALVTAFVFTVLNLLLGDLPLKVIPITLFYSFGLLILSYMSSKIDVIKNSEASIAEETKARFQKIKFYMINLIMPIGITIFQIILMFDKEMQRKF